MNDTDRLRDVRNAIKIEVARLSEQINRHSDMTEMSNNDVLMSVAGHIKDIENKKFLSSLLASMLRHE